MENRKVYIFFHGRFPSEKAASLFVAKEAESFIEVGLQTILVVPRRFNSVKESPHDYYSLSKILSVVYLPTIDLFHTKLLKKYAFIFSSIFFSFSSLFFLFFKAKKNDVIYSNDILLLLLASFFFKNTFYEMHDFPESRLKIFGYFIKRIKRLLIHNKWKIKEVQRIFGLNENKIVYFPNVVDTKMFDFEMSKEEARDILKLPKDKVIVMYTGHLYSWKGVDTLLGVAKNIEEFLFVFVGGTDNDVFEYKEKYLKYQNILFIGHKFHKEVPIWQKASDILVLPNTAKEKISKYYTSPMKLFEYMAIGRPIIASKIPSIEEIVDSNMVYFVDPDNIDSLKSGIMDLVGNLSLQKTLCENARLKVKQYTWDNRALEIKKVIREM